MDAYILIFLLLVSLGLFIWGRWRFDIVALLLLLVSVLLGLVPVDQAFLGFGNPAIITVAAVMIISNTLIRVGSIDFVIQNVIPSTPHVTIHLFILCTFAAFLSAFMNNIGAMALLMPMAMQAAQRNRISPSLLLIPLAFSSAVGGMCTLIGTPPNILISAYRLKVTGQPFELFDFSFVGVFVAVVVLLFIILMGWRFLPKRARSGKEADIFEIHRYLTEVKVTEKSKLLGETVRNFEGLIEGEFVIAGLIRNGRKSPLIYPHMEIEQGDILIVEAGQSDLEKLLADNGLELVAQKNTEGPITLDDTELAEVVVPSGSILEGQTSRGVQLRGRYQLNLLALSRKGLVMRQRLHQTYLRAGDVLLLQGNEDSMRESIIALGLLPLVSRGMTVGGGMKKVVAPLIFLVSILLTVFQVMAVQVAFLGAVVALVLFGIIPVKKLYDSIDWSVIVLLGAMIPVGMALDSTGGTDLIVNGFLSFVGGDVSPVWLLLMLMVVTMSLSDLMNNAATALVMAPIAIAVANAVHASIDPFLMGVAVAASSAFLTPIGHQNNVLVLGPGQYHFSDYFRLGFPVELIVLIISVPLIMSVWPMFPA